MGASRAKIRAQAADPGLCTNCVRRPKYVHKGKRLRLCRECIQVERGISLPVSEKNTTLIARPRADHRGGTKTAQGHVGDNGHAECGATKRNGNPCTRPAGWGTDHAGFGACKNHGGCTPTQRVGAARAQGRLQAHRLGAPIDIGPMDALLWCVRIAAGEVAYFTLQVNLLSKADIVGNPVTVKGKPGMRLDIDAEGHVDDMSSTLVEEYTVHTPALNIWIKARQEALDRLAKFSKLALDAGVAERQVQLAESYGEIIGRIVGGILDALDLTAEQQNRAPDIVREHLSVIENTGEVLPA